MEIYDVYVKLWNNDLTWIKSFRSKNGAKQYIKRSAEKHGMNPDIYKIFKRED